MGSLEMGLEVEMGRASLPIRGREQIREDIRILKKAEGKRRKISNIQSMVQAVIRWFHTSDRRNRPHQVDDSRYTSCHESCREMYSEQCVHPAMSPTEKCTECSPIV